MGKARPRAVVLDAGALIAFERGDGRMRALVRSAVRLDVRLIAPTTVVAQVFRDRARQVPLRALLQQPTTATPPLDLPLAEAAGMLCGRAGTSDIVDASVVLIARQERAPVITSDPDDLARLDPALIVERI